MINRLPLAAIILAVSFMTSNGHADMDLTIEGTPGSGTTTWTWDVTDVFTAAGSLSPTGANKFAQWSDFGDFITVNPGDANGHFQFEPTNNNVVFEIDGSTVGFGDVYVDHDNSGDDLGFIPMNGITYNVGSTLTISGSFEAPIDITAINDVSHPNPFSGVGTITAERPFAGTPDLNLHIRTAVVPEPSSLTLLGIATLALCGFERRRRHSASKAS